jgi:hypothetical protein
MTASQEKKAILERAGYRYNFDRMLYVHRGQRKAFSVEFVDDQPAARIQQCIDEPPTAAGWRFYFNEEPSEGIRRELQRVLDQ